MLLPSLIFSLIMVCSLGLVACYFDYSSIENSYYFGYYASLGFGSGFDYDRGYLYTDPVIVAD